MKRILLLIIFSLGLLPFLDQGKLKIGSGVYAQSFGDEYGGWEDGGWQDGGENGGWGDDWGMEDGDSWDNYGQEFYGTVTELWEEIQTNGLANFDDGYTKYTFDENGVTNSVTYFTWEELETNPELVPNYVWDVMGALEEYYEQEQIYVADFGQELSQHSDPHQLRQFLSERYNSERYVFTVINEGVRITDVIDNWIDFIRPGEALPPGMAPPDMPYGDGPLGDGYYGVNPDDWGDVDFSWPAFEDAPETPYDPGDFDWLYWLYGEGGNWGPDPQSPPTTQEVSGTRDPLEKDAKFNNVLNYVTPSGVVIKLPETAKVFTVQGIDMDMYPNGALFGFKKDGIDYVARFEQMIGLITGFPQFLGFYRVAPDGTVTNEKFTGYEYPNPGEYDNGKIQVVRMRKEVVNGICMLIREIVEYDATGTPTVVSSEKVDVYDAIRFNETVPGTPSEQSTLTCPPGSEPPGNNWNLDQYIANRGVQLVNFLRNNLHSDAKIILYDCATGQAKYTVTKSGANKVPAGNQSAAMAEYNNGSFSEDMAIKGCIQDGKWNYDFKFRNDLFANPHPKVQPHLQEVLNEVKAQAEDEVKKLLKVGTVSIEEKYEVENGRFRKKSMELFPAALAILDVGKHIVKEAAMPTWIWDGASRSYPAVAPAGTKQAYDNSPFNMPSLIAGATDQLVDEATGILQLTKAGYQFIRHPKQTVQGIWNSVKSINRETMKKLLVDVSGVANYQAGGDPAFHQSGKHGVQFAMTVLLPVKNLSKGVDIVKKTGSDVGDIQKFIPDGPNNQAVSDILKHSVENNQVVRNIDNEKLITKNTLQGGEVRFNAIDKSGEIYDSKALNNMDEITDDVLKKADASDLAEAAEDAAIHNQMKNQPAQFINGKDFERNVTLDPAHTSRVEAATGLDLSGFDKASQIQIKMSDGSYIVADNIYYRPIPNTDRFEVVINESKLSTSSPFTQNQTKFLNELQNGNNIFEIRTSKLANSGTPVPKGATFEVSAFVKTVSDGTSGISNYTVTQIP